MNDKKGHPRRRFLRNSGLLASASLVAGVNLPNEAAAEDPRARRSGGCEEDYDVIVVGAGSAGSVLTRRLADAGKRVLVLEAGGSDLNPAIWDPARLAQLWHSPNDWDYYTVPQTRAQNRKLHLPRGKVLGGSHSLNGAIWVRGAPQDFDHWASLGNRGWAWKDVLPTYVQIENFDGPPSKTRGTKGLLRVTSNYQLHPIQQAIIQAATQIGIRENPDYNGESQDGIAKQQVTMLDGRRVTTWMAYATDALYAGRVTALTHALVHRLLFRGKRVVGVEFERAGKLRQAYGNEVVLCTGAIGSPLLLMRSGIGPADHLRSVGVSVVHDSPGVGKDLHDHLLAPVIFTTETPIDPPPFGTSATQTHWFHRSRPGLALPDTQPIVFSVPMYEPWMQGPAWGFSLMAGMISPKSRGAIRLSGAKVNDVPLIDPNIFAEEDDLRSLMASVRQCRELGVAPALSGRSWRSRELYPGPSVKSEAQLREYVQKTAITYHHVVGTCRMGVDRSAVVDPTLRVHGVEGLRVADASIMPRVTTGNTNAPAILIGEKAAGFMLG